jgi:hypothetical protein
MVQSNFENGQTAVASVFNNLFAEALAADGSQPMTGPLTINSNGSFGIFNPTLTLFASGDTLVNYPVINALMTVSGAPNSVGGPINADLYLESNHGNLPDQQGVTTSPSQYAGVGINVFKLPPGGSYTSSATGPQSWIYYGTQAVSGNPQDSAYESPTLTGEIDSFFNGTDLRNARQCGLLITGHFYTPQASGGWPVEIANGGFSWEFDQSVYPVIGALSTNQYSVACIEGRGSFVPEAFNTSMTSGSSTSLAVDNYLVFLRSTGFYGGLYVSGQAVLNPTDAIVNFTGAISGTVLTVYGTPTGGSLAANMSVIGSGVTIGTYITSGSGSTWAVNNSQNVSSTSLQAGTQLFVTQPATSPLSPCYAKVYNGNTYLGSITVVGVTPIASGTTAGVLTLQSAPGFNIASGCTITPTTFYMWQRGGSYNALDSFGANYYGYDTTRSTMFFSRVVQFDGGITASGTVTANLISIPSNSGAGRLYLNESTTSNYLRYNPFDASLEVVQTVSGTDTALLKVADQGSGGGVTAVNSLSAGKGFAAWGVVPPSGTQPTTTLTTSTITDNNAKAAINYLIGIINGAGLAAITTN